MLFGEVDVGEVDAVSDEDIPLAELPLKGNAGANGEDEVGVVTVDDDGGQHRGEFVPFPHRGQNHLIGEEVAEIGFGLAENVLASFDPHLSGEIEDVVLGLSEDGNHFCSPFSLGASKGLFFRNLWNSKAFSGRE